MFKEKAAFFDRDGTINVDTGYLHSISDFQLIPGVLDFMKALQNLNYKIIIISNQSGIGRGLFSIAEYKELTEWMIHRFKDENVEISGTYFCPHHPNASIPEFRKECNCRKPGIGMFLRAIDDFNIDIDSSVAIGDRCRDLAICKTTDCLGILINNTESQDELEEIKAYNNIVYAKDYSDALKYILEKQNCKRNNMCGGN